MTKTLLHLSNNSKVYVGICKTIANLANIESYSANLHDRLYDTVAEIKPDVIVLPIHEYTAEFHTFINDKKHNPKILMIIDPRIPEESITSIMKNIVDKTNILVISNKHNITNFPNITYEEMYDSDLFVDNEYKRLDKVGIILHENNEVNKQIVPALYPHTSDVVCFNNNKFDHVTNLGILSMSDLSSIFNTYEYILDMTDMFKLEIMACGAKCIDNTNDIVNNVLRRKTIPKIPELKKHSFINFLMNNTQITEFLGA